MNADENGESEKYEESHRATRSSSRRVRKMTGVVDDFKYSRHIKSVRASVSKRRNQFSRMQIFDSEVS